MPYPNYYWQRGDDAPFVFFVRIINAYCHPETGGDEHELAEWANRAEQTTEMVRFKDEFRQLLGGEFSRLPDEALSTAAEYEDGSDEAYLRRLWHELYGDEPVQPGRSVS
ncbi:MAG TPA: hypothetical protein VGH27_26290 [Streptosporangiaceae bacterium]|jgi:hypothetical protein